MNSAAILSQGKTVAGYVGAKNSKIDASQYLMINIFSYSAKGSIGSTCINGNTIKMILLTKVRTNFHTQLLNTFSKIQPFTT